ncbi:MAG: winged helix DNA-binding protein [Gammaproteobacteria bacterium]|nr:winged helix DNA-binding protein [Gammaproteobacteria bacterium]
MTSEERKVLRTLNFGRKRLVKEIKELTGLNQEAVLNVIEDLCNARYMQRSDSALLEITDSGLVALDVSPRKSLGL